MGARVSKAWLKKLRAADPTAVPRGPSKLKNIRTTVDGETYASKREAKRSSILGMLARHGKITDLKRQVPYKLVVNDLLICTYVADFTYVDEDGCFVVEDAKGVRTRPYIIKRNLMKALHGIVILES